jgi:WD40 repeat protein
MLAIGCEDGAARLFRYDGGVLEYAKSLPTTGARILCVSFHPVLPRLFMGCDDGTIRCVNESSGQGLFRMIGDVLRGVSTYIWSIKVLSDSTVITGDSRGHVQLWDGETGVLMITLHQHIAEVLALEVSPDETQIFASGVDCRVTCVRRVTQPTQQMNKYGSEDVEPPSPSDSHWVYSTSHRPHSHDVFALAVCNTASVGPVLISGGMDTKLCSYSIDEFARTRPSWILPVPASGLVQTSADFSTVAVRHRDRIDIWGVNPSPLQAKAALKAEEAALLVPKDTKKGKKSKKDEAVIPVADVINEDVDDESRCSLSLRLETKGSEHIHCFALSPDGSIVACSTTAETRIWSLNLKHENEELSVQKLLLPPAARGFVQALAFSADGRRVAGFTATGAILLLSLGGLLFIYILDIFLYLCLYGWSVIWMIDYITNTSH